MDKLFYFIGFSSLFVTVVWCVKEKYHLEIISLGTVVFVGYLDPESLIVLLVSSIGSFYLLQKIDTNRFIFFFVLVCLLLVFVLYKLKTTLEFGVFNAALPLGLSFYLFRLIHYAIEVYKGNLKKLSFKVFNTYMLYLPVIVVGPIIRIDDWQREVKRRRWDARLFSAGLERILYGLVKVVVLGNYVFSIKLADYIESLSVNQIWLANYLDCVRYAGNSYMQFAGYTDVAVGFSMLLGLKIAENFDYPFLAKNINDFWKRWHISLSQWCRDYIFSPIASSTRLPWVAILTSMLVLGLWHELSLRYILWAVFHGSGIVIWNVYRKYVKLDFDGLRKNIYDAIGVFVTLNFVIISFAWVKEESIASSIKVFMVLIGWT